MKAAPDASPAVSEPPRGAGRRALVIRIGALGDVLLTRRLSYSLSLAGFRTTLLAPSRHASLLLADPWIEAVLDSESPRFAAVFAGSWPEDSAFDVAVTISSSVGLNEAASRGAARVVRIAPESGRDDTQVARQWAEAAGSLGPPFVGDLPPLAIDTRQAIVAQATLIHPGSGSPKKNWPLERFREVSRRLTGLGHRVAWIRGPAEPDFGAEVFGEPVIDRPSLPALAATLSASTLYLGNDSGVSHLAAAVGARTVALFGATHASVWSPDGPLVQTVSSDAEGLGGLGEITVEQVMAAADRVTRLSLSGR